MTLSSLKNRESKREECLMKRFKEDAVLMLLSRNEK